MSDTLLAELRRSSDPEDRRVAGLLAPLAPGAGGLPMPAADLALSGFLVEVLGGSAPAGLAPDPGEPTLVVQLGPASVRPVRRPARRRLRPAVLAAAAAIAVVTAVGAAAATGVGRGHDAHVVVTPAVTRPHPTSSQRSPDDLVAHGRSTPSGTGAAGLARRHHASTDHAATIVVAPGASATGVPGSGDQQVPTTTPSPRATRDDGGSGGGSGDDATGSTSGGDDGATPTPTPTPTPTQTGDGSDGIGGPDGSGGAD
jgi:hypothetical protein